MGRGVGSYRLCGDEKIRRPAEHADVCLYVCAQPCTSSLRLYNGGQKSFNESKLRICLILYKKGLCGCSKRNSKHIVEIFDRDCTVQNRLVNLGHYIQPCLVGFDTF